MPLRFNKRDITVESEASLVTKMIGGDTVAFEQLFNEYGFRLFRFAKGYLHEDSDAEEIVQNVFLKVWSKRTSLKSVKSFKSFVFTIAFNEIRNTFNKKTQERAFKEEVAEELLCNSKTDLLEMNYFSTMQLIDQLIEELPQKRKEIFILSKKEGLDIQEIADYLKISEKTVRNQLSTALDDLKTSVRKQGLKELLFFMLFVH
ncbi:RNA polymerase sigma-70 factor [Prolixibacteraceae bacterium JC049]|nr:RNA polymerase sigma-70 factor [Prolixibacteraceae bacterium JC049]